MSNYRQLEFDFQTPKPVELLTPDEILERANEHELPNFYENSKFERKPAGIHAKELAQYYSMFANTKPDGGIIGVGISDDGTLTGCRSLEPQAIDRIEQTGIQYCPDARYEIKRVGFSRTDGTRDFVILIRIYYHDTRLVETTDGNAYIRKGASKHKLNEGEKGEIRISKGEVSQ